MAMYRFLLPRLGIALFLFAGATAAHAAPSGVRFIPSSGSPGRYDFAEVTIQVDQPDAANPFTDAAVEGRFGRQGAEPVRVDGFCDSADGSVFRIRFLPTQAGEYHYSVTYRQGAYQTSHAGQFTAQDSKGRGLIRVDKEHPWHFVWEGTGEHYFWNGTTTYWLLGWDEETIRRNIDRLARLKVNRLRVAINGRVKDGRAWYENVFPTEKFSFRMNPWVAQRPDSVENPGFDVTRFNLPHWQKIERMLRHARDKDMAISIIFYVDGARPGVDPFGKARMGQEDEQRYYRYAVARLAGFSNVMWDVTNEYHLFRNEEWTNKMGAFIKECDPYDHVMSVHGPAGSPSELPSGRISQCTKAGTRAAATGSCSTTVSSSRRRDDPSRKSMRNMATRITTRPPGVAVARPRPARRTIAAGWRGACTWPGAIRRPANVPTPAPAGARTPAAAGSTAGATIP